MTCPERIVQTLPHLRETAQAAQLAVRAETVPPTRNDFVRIGLMPHVPYQFVIRRIQHIVQRHSQFDHAQTRPQVARVR